VTSSFALPMLRSMVVNGVLPGDAAIVLAFAAAAAMAVIGVLPGDKGIPLAVAAIAAAASTFLGGGDGVSVIVALLGEIWVR
jgi:hypothetical protein